MSHKGTETKRDDILELEKDSVVGPLCLELWTDTIGTAGQVQFRRVTVKI